MGRDFGWVQFPGIRKAHYVLRSKALCGRYAYWGRLYDRMEYGRESKCAECLERLERRERELVFSPAQEDWLAQFDWKMKASGKDE